MYEKKNSQIFFLFFLFIHKIHNIDNLIDIVKGQVQEYVNKIKKIWGLCKLNIILILLRTLAY